MVLKGFSEEMYDYLQYMNIRSLNSGYIEYCVLMLLVFLGGTLRCIVYSLSYCIYDIYKYVNIYLLYRMTDMNYEELVVN